MAKIMPDDRSKTDPKTGLMGGVMIAYFILILHVVLIALIGLVVIFLGGIAGHLLWIVIGGILLISGSALWFYHRMKKQGRELRDTLNSDIF
jgi:ABC-type bacteriocin/lantibiotic exporter with double-glycine peptidase domain